VQAFNDLAGRTKEDILALYDFAIKGEQMPSPPEE
jgi:hypothetical protein